jgi:hypothetical protein
VTTDLLVSDIVRNRSVERFGTSWGIAAGVFSSARGTPGRPRQFTSFRKRHLPNVTEMAVMGRATAIETTR